MENVFRKAFHIPHKLIMEFVFQYLFSRYKYCNNFIPTL